MNTKSRAIAAVVAAAMLAGAVPSRAEPTPSVVTGFLVFLGVTLGLVAYNHDFGGADKRLEVDDQSGRKKDGARIQIVPTPERGDSEGASQEIAAGIAFTAKF